MFRSSRLKRKIANENELVSSIAARHQDTYRARGLQLDTLPFDEQLRVVGETDVMIGMHGAGLSHVTVMPRHGALIESSNRLEREKIIISLILLSGGGFSTEDGKTVIRHARWVHEYRIDSARVAPRNKSW